jgi:hypothetical protein
MWVERMVITNNGNLGIGTTAPSQALDVAGNIQTIGSLTAVGNVSAGKGAFSDATTNGTAVEGRANVGMYAWGVYGLAGEGVGVMGRSVSTTGYGGRFENLGGGKAFGALVNATEVMTVDLAGVAVKPAGGFSVVVFKQ